MADFLSWWDGVELWLTGRGFVLQTVVVMPIVLLLAYGLAVLSDGLLGRGVELLRRVRHEKGAQKTPVAETAKTEEVAP